MRTMILVKRICIVIIMAVFPVFVGGTYAAYPDKPVEIIVGRGAGGSTDVIARTFAPFYAKYLGVPVVVKNVAGGNGFMANKTVFEANPDGYMLLTGVFPADALLQLRQTTPYDFKEFTCIHALAGGDSNGLIVSYNSKFKTFAEILEASKQKGAGLTLAGVGTSSATWVFALLLKQGTGFTAKYIPFDSGNEATMSAIGGHVTGALASTINFPDLTKEKKILVLGVASPKRLFYLPDTPTFVELGYPKVVFTMDQFLLAPPKLPDDRKKVLEEAAAKAIADPEFAALAKKQGFSADPKKSDEVKKSILGIFNYLSEILVSADEMKK